MREVGKTPHKISVWQDAEAVHASTRRIGPYKLLQKIGEGGMGTVWMAEQTEPIRRRVALKVIRAGIDTKQVFALFEAERQALAMMDHQNIAKVSGAKISNSTDPPSCAMEMNAGA